MSLHNTWTENTSPALTPEILREYVTKTEFRALVPTCAVGRKLCITKLGFIGFALPFSSEGDDICFL
jgi:hypothetical protein